jgi:predicted DNA-binding transcriptional regulator AlpA
MMSQQVACKHSTYQPLFIEAGDLGRQPKIGQLNGHELEAYLKISAATVRRWAIASDGPKFVKIGSSVRYKPRDVETWLNSCPGVR